MGFVRRGFRAVAAVEIDGDAAESYRLNVGLEPIVRDIRDVTGQELLTAAGLRPGECTLMFGCPPCQSFTVLRRGAALTDLDIVREGLPSQYVRLVGELKPAFVAFENVPGMVEGRGREQFDALRSDLEGLGYKLKWDIVDAVDYGVPQHRRRLLVVGSRTVQPKLPARTHSGTPGAGLHHLLTVRDAIGSVRPLRSGESDPVDVLHRARNHDAITLRRLAAIPEGGGRTHLPEELQLACHREHSGHYDVYGRMAWDKPAPTITSGCTNVTRGRFAHPSQNRAITLREAMLLQTFPDSATLIGTGDGMAQQVGNAVPTRLAEQIADAILAAGAQATTVEDAA
jgi:DNA (cytosine-5)-methyltransferase 1